MKKVTVYTTTTCPYCIRVKALFHRKGVRIQEIDLTDDDDARSALIARTGLRTVPQVFIDETFYGGCEDVERLDAEGKLDLLLA